MRFLAHTYRSCGFPIAIVLQSLTLRLTRRSRERTRTLRVEMVQLTRRWHPDPHSLGGPHKAGFVIHHKHRVRPSGVTRSVRAL